MKNSKTHLAQFMALLALAAGACSLSAQTPVAAQPQAQPAMPQSFPQSGGAAMQSSEPSLTVRSDKALESFEPPANEEYTLGAGDEITVEVPGHPELAGKHTIGPDGLITISVAGSVHVRDLTREDASKAINEALGKFYTDPNATVKIDKYSANRVRVIGYVQHPG